MVTDHQDGLRPDKASRKESSHSLPGSSTRAFGQTNRSLPGRRNSRRLRQDRQVMTSSASSTYSCSVIICAYTEKRWRDLVAAVESLRQQTLRPTEIVVVIDHNPALLERVQAGLCDVVAVENQEAHGL